MSFVAKVLAAAVVATAVVGCAPMPQQAFNKSAHTHLKSIAVAPIGTPERVAVRIATPVGASFGLIGAVVEETRAANAAKEMEDILAKAGFDFRSTLRHELEAALGGTGLAVTMLAGERAAEERGKFLAKPAATEADMILDVYFPYVGYGAAGATTDYRPSVTLHAKLTSAVDGQLLFTDQIVYNPMLANTKAIVVEADPQYVYTDRDAMQAADPAAVARGLETAIRAVTAELAKQLR